MILSLATGSTLCSGQATEKTEKTVVVQTKISDNPTKEEKAFYDHLYRLVASGEVDSVKSVVEFTDEDSFGEHQTVKKIYFRNGSMMQACTKPESENRISKKISTFVHCS